MNWKQRLFKPKWQHKNADVRLESVATEQDPQLISSLVEIAATDENPGVRSAAIKRLHQLENILKLIDNETDGDVITLLEERIRQLASASNESRPPLKFRLQVVEITKDRDLIEHLARHAPEAALRRAALEKVTRQGVLGDCCLHDNDADNRRFAASRITQQSSLIRVINGLRKRDKSLQGELQARLHREMLEQDDPDAIQVEALRICSALEKLVLETDEQKSTRSRPLHEAWKHIGDKVTTDMNDRYRRACERLANNVIVSPTTVVMSDTNLKTVSEPEDTIEEEPSSGTTEPPGSNASLAAIATAITQYEEQNKAQPRAASVSKLKQQLKSAWKHCTPPHPQDQVHWEEACAKLSRLESLLEHKRLQSEQELSDAQSLLVQLETELEQGELHKALESRAKLQQVIKGHGKNRDWQTINSKMAGMQSRLRELRDWQHWSNNKIRHRLITEMEVLPAADLHPDALIDRVKSLQAEWKALQQSEQIPGDKKFNTAPWMWRKFSAAGHAAFETVKPFLDKRSEIQKRHAQALSTFCTELEQLALTGTPDWNVLGKALNEGRRKLRDLDKVPFAQRQKIYRKLKSALDKANAVLQEHYLAVEKHKMKLIRAASQLLHVPERSEAISQAKSLQSDWKAAGSLWRSREQELWEQFREHLDPLFSELKEQQASVRMAEDERLAAQKALCKEMSDILESDDDLTTHQGKVQGLQDSWRDIQHPDRKLLTAFQDMVTRYQQTVRQIQLKMEETNRERWWLKSALLHELTVSGRTQAGTISKRVINKVAKTWPADSSDDDLENNMDQIYRDILAGNQPGLTEDELENMINEARILCIGLEFIAGLPSPKEDHERRMKYQVDRLAESMSGASTRQPANVEANQAEMKWLTMYALPENEFSVFGKRIKQALTKITESV